MLLPGLGGSQRFNTRCLGWPVEQHRSRLHAGSCPKAAHSTWPHSGISSRSIAYHVLAPGPCCMASFLPHPPTMYSVRLIAGLMVSPETLHVISTLWMLGADTWSLEQPRGPKLEQGSNIANFAGSH